MQEAKWLPVAGSTEEGTMAMGIGKIGQKIKETTTNAQQKVRVSREKTAE